jgi:lysophospholipase L1-like esterase
MEKNDISLFSTVYKTVIAVILFFSVASISLVSGAPTKIMCLGDSITGSPGCWRALLWQKLENNGYTNIDFVGTLPPQGCGFTYDGENEGHGGIWATQIVSGNQLPPWLAATTPDIILMHLGTNDVWNTTIPTATIIAAFDTMVNQMRVSNPNMKILVAQILPMNPTGCSLCPQGAIDLNNAIPGWAAGKTTSQSPIVVVDQWTGFNSATDSSDGVHPNDAGNQKICDKWYPALVAFLSGTTITPDPSPVVTPVPATPAPTGSALLGDVNSSGSIDIVDALLIAQYYVGLPVSNFNSAVADVTKDNTIDIIDALRIAQCYVGMISCSF